MDKRVLLDSMAADGEERVLLGHVWDLYQRTQSRNVPEVTAFLSPREQAAVQRLMQRMGAERAVLFGGYGDAQRRRVYLLPEWQEAPEEATIAALRCTFYRGDRTPGHRDFLGSLMGLGITRGSVGDILVSPESADVLVTAEVAPFLLQQWTAAGRVPLRVESVALSEILVPPQQFREIRDTVASLRLDSVTAVGFSTSRAKAAEAIAAGQVEVNWQLCRRPDQLVAAGDVITLHHVGKCCVDSVGQPTKKGRLPLCVKRYL